MEQIVDKLNKIAKKIDENVEIPESDLIIDSLDAITTALGGTPNDSKLIVDKLEDIAGVATGGGGGGIENPILSLTIDTTRISGDQGTIDYYEITENNILANVITQISGQQTYNFEFPVVGSIYDDDDTIYYDWINRGEIGGFVSTIYTITSSNEVNCTVNIIQESEPHYMSITITDPTQPASATLTVTNP